MTRPRDPTPDPPPGNTQPPADPGVPVRWVSEIHRGQAAVVPLAAPIVHHGQPLTGVPPTPLGPIGVLSP